MDTFPTANWNAVYKQALRDVEDKPVYVSGEERELEQAPADDEPWMIHPHIQEAVENATKIRVELIDDKTNLRSVQSDIRDAKHVGLTLMGEKISRYSRPLLIVITTKTKLYCIDPNDIQCGIDFLKSQLNDPRLKFWVTNGIDEADALYRHYDIDLRTVGSRTICCRSVHCRLSQMIRKSGAAYRQMYPSLAYSRQPTKMAGFARMVEVWLDISKENFAYDRFQLIHLKSRPLNLTATNIIMKRCLLVRALGMKLEHYWLIEQSYTNFHQYNLLPACNDRVRQDILKALQVERNKGQKNCVLTIHIDGFNH